MVLTDVGKDTGKLFKILRYEFQTQRLSLAKTLYLQTVGQTQC